MPRALTPVRARRSSRRAIRRSAPRSRSSSTAPGCRTRTGSRTPAGRPRCPAAGPRCSCPPPMRSTARVWSGTRSTPGRSSCSRLAATARSGPAPACWPAAGCGWPSCRAAPPTWRPRRCVSAPAQRGAGHRLRRARDRARPGRRGRRPVRGDGRHWPGRRRGGSDPGAAQTAGPGWVAYAYAGLAHLHGPPSQFTIRLDGGPPLLRAARCVVVGNAGLLPAASRCYPTPAPTTACWTSASWPRPAWPLARVGYRVLTRSRHDDHRLERFRARHVHITATTPLPRETDGEIITPSPILEVTLRPASLIVKTRAPRGATVDKPRHSGLRPGALTG